LKNRGWKETDSELDWDIMWADRDWITTVMDYVHLAPNQRVNHFRNHYEVLVLVNRLRERTISSRTSKSTKGSWRRMVRWMKLLSKLFSILESTLFP